MKDVQDRVIWLLGILACGLLLISAQLYRLTIAESSAWSMQAEENKTRVISSQGPRGAIYDRNGRSLATSEPAFAAVLVDQNAATVEKMLPTLSLLLAGGDQARAQEMANRVRQRVAENKENWRQYEPITIARKLDQQVVATLVERRQEFPGVVLVTESARNYPWKSLGGSVLGYVGVISQDQLKSGEFKDYNGNEIVGKDGLELFYERELQGKQGERSIIVDLYGRPMGDHLEKPPTPGNNLHLTLDLDLQKVAEEALVRQMDWIKRQNDPEANPMRAALVVMDVRTGAVLAMASVPTFDPNLFVTAITDKQWHELVNHPARPLTNHSLSGYAPGSTYKMAVGLAGLELGVVGAYEQIDCPAAYWNYHKPKNWTTYSQGFADVARALAISCDPYFYELGHRMGIDRMASFMERFGFGKPLGVDLPGEQAGVLPTQKSYGDRWVPGQVLSVSIGQGDVLITPLQLAAYTAAIANGGNLMRPYLVSEVRTPGGDLVQSRPPTVLGRLGVAPQNLARIQQGMRLTVSTAEGTAHFPFLGFQLKGGVAAKTGSAETGYQWANAFTVAYAPYESPEIAVAVMVEGGAHGSWTAPAVRAVMAQYFGIKETVDPGRANKAD